MKVTDVFVTRINLVFVFFMHIELGCNLHKKEKKICFLTAATSSSRVTVSNRGSTSEYLIYIYICK